jgi:hypothetical protein
MATIDGGEVVFSTTLVLGTSQMEARVDWAQGSVVIRFLNEVSDLTVNPSIENNVLTLSVSDGKQKFSYGYDGRLNEDGAPAYNLNLAVTPIGDGLYRPRLLALTIARRAK